MIATPAGPVLIDTDILIDFLRGGEGAAAFLEATRAHLTTRNRRHFPMFDEVLVPY